MIHFPPARFPTDPALGIEPCDPAIDPYPDGMAPASLRADSLFYVEGFKTLANLMFVTGDGRILQVIDVRAGFDWGVKYFSWNGKTRRIINADDPPSRRELLELLGDAWQHGYSPGNALFDEAQERIRKALAYEGMNDLDIVARNFDVLRRETARILSTPALRAGALGDLHATFAYFGMKRFPVSALLKVWEEGRWRVECRAKEGERHEAYVISGGGGLSMGSAYAYCPACGRASWIATPFGHHFKEILAFIPGTDDGYRLDEILEEIGGELPDPAGTAEGERVR